jgi:hypothetical protein
VRFPSIHAYLILSSGLIHTLGNIMQTHFPDDMDWILHRWLSASAATVGIGHWVSDATRDIHPVQCHSHNDYWRDAPLFDAIRAGCASVEADIWHQYDDLYVGHRKFQLHPDRTLRSLYINPLIDLLEKQNERQCDPLIGCPSRSPSDGPLAGVFSADPDLPLILLVDFKTSAEPTWRKLQAQLAPLRERNLITYFNGTAVVPGPVVVVGTGNAVFANVTSSNGYREIFYDAPLEKLADMSAIWPNPNRVDDETRWADKNSTSPSHVANVDKAGGYNSFNSYYASASFSRAVGHELN